MKANHQVPYYSLYPPTGLPGYPVRSLAAGARTAPKGEAASSSTPASVSGCSSWSPEPAASPPVQLSFPVTVYAVAAAQSPGER